ncbi:hypothetical protein PR202_ga16624 [Eleusine coracana subsp. coracana]|uniref:Uncharacterized protein n=1 Tax=Eleusine coracana subsp. coracana TaxID=191504 RepID=A0AAV5CLZ1_ELECO|nr:hypothetical protein PR202_ga16624 [Eleusine coracana subsp. coracana]
MPSGGTVAATSSSGAPAAARNDVVGNGQNSPPVWTSGTADAWTSVVVAGRTDGGGGAAAMSRLRLARVRSSLCAFWWPPSAWEL